ncbi:hypothetical protein IH980_00230 [Patescibacteria group bacterium]|nr:hypothetical protein [Patescibacteria group bacterium]
MRMPELLESLGSIQGRCDVGACAVIPECEFAPQVISELRVDQTSDAVASRVYDACPHSDEVRGLYEQFLEAEE